MQVSCSVVRQGRRAGYRTDGKSFEVCAARPICEMCVGPSRRSLQSSNASGRLRQASWTPASARATAPPPRVVPAPQRWFPLRIPLVGTPLVGTADATPRCHGLNLGMKKGPTGVAGPWSEFNSEVPLMLDHRPANPGTAGVRHARLPIAPPRLKCLCCFQHWPFCTTGRLVSVRLKPVPPKSEL
jgi:hypothetical protein